MKLLFVFFIGIVLFFSVLLFLCSQSLQIVLVYMLNVVLCVCIHAIKPVISIIHSVIVTHNRIAQ